MAKNTLLCHRSTTRQNDLTFTPKTPESTARFERGGWSICSSNVWSIYLYRRGSQCINTLQLESSLVCSALPSAQLSGQASAQFSAQCISQIAILSAAVTSFTNTSRPLGGGALQTPMQGVENEKGPKINLREKKLQPSWKSMADKQTKSSSCIDRSGTRRKY